LMNGRRAGRIRAGIVVAALALRVASAPAQSQTNTIPQIFFLHLRLTQKDITLVESSVRPGVVKFQPNPETKEIQFELVSASGKVLWTGATDDPRNRHVEFEDPPRSGRLKRKTAPLNEAEFMIRVPVVAGAQRIDFYTSVSPSAEGKPDKPSSRKLIGSTALPSQTNTTP